MQRIAGVTPAAPDRPRQAPASLVRDRPDIGNADAGRRRLDQIGRARHGDRTNFVDRFSMIGAAHIVTLQLRVGHRHADLTGSRGSAGCMSGDCDRCPYLLIPTQLRLAVKNQDHRVPAGTTCMRPHRCSRTLVGYGFFSGKLGVGLSGIAPGRTAHTWFPPQAGRPWRINSLFTGTTHCRRPVPEYIQADMMEAWASAPAPACQPAGCQVPPSPVEQADQDYRVEGSAKLLAGLFRMPSGPIRSILPSPGETLDPLALYIQSGRPVDLVRLGTVETGRRSTTWLTIRKSPL